jgi:anti-sigma regulatory factor (Ser/Thr protein kinase)
MAEVQPHSDYLTFPFLDDVLLLPPHERLKKISQSSFYRIGPLVEYAIIDEAAPVVLQQANSQNAQRLLKTMNVVSEARIETSSNAKKVEFMRLPLNEASCCDNAWVSFFMRLHNAAKKAGLQSTFTGQLAGTFEEMVGNAVEHSDHPETGMAGYRWEQGEFEYVVADKGIGIMRSLKKHPDYQGVSDDGQALETALTDGVSCKGRQASRGRGFNRLILNIASRNSFLRFRSGDHCHTVDGTKPTPLRATSQLCSTLQGFHISVVCRP